MNTGDIDDNDDKYKRDIDSQCSAIQTLLNRQQQTDNILLLGSTGTGKSSLVNTISQAITAEWNQQAQVGRPSGAAIPVTDKVKWFYNCNVGETHTSRNLTKDKLPNVVDMAGYSGQDLKYCKDILLGIVDGKIPVESSVTKLMELLQKNPRYIDARDADNSRKITKIVFIASLTEDINDNFVQVVLDVARPVGERRRELPVYGALTKFDKVGSNVACGVTQETLKDHASKMVRCLGIEGTEDDYFSTISNYTTSLRPRNFKVEAKVLNFIRKILVQVPRRNSATDPLSLPIKNTIKLIWLQCEFYLFYVFVVVIAVLLFFMFL